MYYVSPHQMWRFYGYYGGLNVVGDMQTYASMQMILHFRLFPFGRTKCRLSNMKIICTQGLLITLMRLLITRLVYPIPNSTSPEQFWFRFSIEDNNAFATGSYDSGVDGINNMNTMPMENIPFKSINSIGQQWIRRFSLALSKETLGQIRGKFGNSVPIPVIT